MTKDKQPNKPPTFLVAMSTILLGIMLVGFGSFVMIFINYFAFVSVGLGAVILYIGVIQWRLFQKTLPENDDEYSHLDNDAHRFGDKETLAEKRP